MSSSEKCFSLASTGSIVPHITKWSCVLYDKAWGATVYKIKKGDFCSKEGFLRDRRPVLPSCNKMIFPVVTFYFYGGDECDVTMSLGAKSPQNVKCINKVTGPRKIENGKEIWIIYATHGLFRNSVSTRYNWTIVAEGTKKYYEYYNAWLATLKNRFSKMLMNK